MLAGRLPSRNFLLKPREPGDSGWGRHGEVGVGESGSARRRGNVTSAIGPERKAGEVAAVLGPGIISVTYFTLIITVHPMRRGDHY